MNSLTISLSLYTLFYQALKSAIFGVSSIVLGDYFFIETKKVNFVQSTIV